MMNVKSLNLKEFLFVAALAIKPFYLSASGTLQISDLLFVTLFGILIVENKMTLKMPNGKTKEWIKIFIIIIVYQFIINFTVYFIQVFKYGASDIRFLKFNLFYLFNLFVCISIFQLYSTIGYKRVCELFLFGIILSLFVCYIGVVVNYSGTGRVRAFFNNPNQLGYYSIVVMTVFVIFHEYLDRMRQIVFISLSMVLNILSLSKASIIGSAFLLIVYAIISQKGKGLRQIIVSIIIISAVFALIYLLLYSESEYITKYYYIRSMRYRLFNMQNENDTDLGTGRGYDRIFEIGPLIICGVGEGDFTRFVAASGKELHSMYASVVVSYGIIGFIGYIRLFKDALINSTRKYTYLLGFTGILLYCITHNGIRSTLLWSLISMMILSNFNDRNNSDKTEIRVR